MNRAVSWPETASGNQMEEREALVAYLTADPRNVRAALKSLYLPYHPSHQNTAWALGKYLENKEACPDAIYQEILALLHYENVHDAVHRNIWRGLQFQSIPEAYEGELLDMAIRNFMDTKTAVAIRVFSLQVSYQIAVKYPEIGKEIKQVLEGVLPHVSPALKSRGKRILGQLGCRQV